MHTYRQDTCASTFIIYFQTDNQSIPIARRDEEADALALVNYLNGGTGIWPSEWPKPESKDFGYDPKHK